MYNVLVVDFSIFKNSIVKIFKNKGYDVELCESAYDAMKRLKAVDFDLVIADVELPGDNAFDLYKYISTHYPHIATIMTTEKSMDTFFDVIFHEGIGNVLSKPFRKDEILNLAGKLITKKNIASRFSSERVNSWTPFLRAPLISTASPSMTTTANCPK